ncbi:phenylalanine--tRNA ligase subunit beta [Candidatus Uhrbacteria bacterium]|nr:phenylalanine--tRNA ligase subunit beta [Candidatus Uhrbacteria bacterium]
MTHVLPGVRWACGGHRLSDIAPRMDLQVSYNWLREFVDVELPPEELADQLALHSVSVERLHRLDEHLARIVVGRVVRLEAHPHADKLRIAHVALRETVRAGGRMTTAQIVPVVCGGVNLREGMLIAYAKSGARVRWHGQGELVTLAPTDIRGVRSDGMICAASEMGLGAWFPEGEREILDCTFLEAERPSSSGALVGALLASALGLDDVVFDVEITTNRPDLLGVEGLAREVAVITGSRLRAPRTRPGRTDRTAGATLGVRVEDRVGCPRYGAVRISGVTVAASPWWLRRRLLVSGISPIANVVDVTNYAMLAYGQPMHAFDAATLRRAPRMGKNDRVEIIVRRARSGEQLLALDARTYALTPEDLIIADAERPIALAGIMGGAETGVTAATTDVVLECAVFDATCIRATSRRLALRTDAVARFEKRLPPALVDAVRDRAAELLMEIAGGTVEARTIVGAAVPRVAPIAFRPTMATAAIGVPITPAAMRRTLTALGCAVRTRGATWQVVPPWWRTGDLAGAHDLVEEVARCYGYHRVPARLPSGSLPAGVLPPQSPRTEYDVEYRAKTVLADIGATEIATYALTSTAAVERCGFLLSQCVQLENPLSEEFIVLRPSLIPTTLPVIAANAAAIPKALLFELANIYIPQGDIAPMRRARTAVHGRGLPREEARLLIAAYDRRSSGDLVFQVKGMVEHLVAQLGVSGMVFAPAAACVLPSGVCLWHPGRSMDVVIGDVLAGTMGEIHPVVLESLGIAPRVAIADLDWAVLRTHSGTSMPLLAPSAFPSVKRDIAMVLDRRTPYGDVIAAIASAHPLLSACVGFDAYEGHGVAEGMKNLAFHLNFAADRTLTAEEVDAAVGTIVACLQSRFGALLRT